MLKRGCYIVPVALKEIDISLLQKYAFGYKLELKIIKDISKLKNRRTMLKQKKRKKNQKRSPLKMKKRKM